MVKIIIFLYSKRGTDSFSHKNCTIYSKNCYLYIVKIAKEWQFLLYELYSNLYTEINNIIKNDHV